MERPSEPCSFPIPSSSTPAWSQIQAWWLTSGPLPAPVSPLVPPPPKADSLAAFHLASLGALDLPDCLWPEWVFLVRALALLILPGLGTLSHFLLSPTRAHSITELSEISLCALGDRGDSISSSRIPWDIWMVSWLTSLSPI